MDRIIYNKYSSERAREFNIRTEISVDEKGERKVRKYAVGVDSIPHVKRMYDMYVRLQRQYKESYVQPCPCVLEDDVAVFSYIEGYNLKEHMIELIGQGEQQRFYEMFDCFVKFVKDQGRKKKLADTVQFRQIFGVDYPEKQEETLVHNPANLDLIFDNIIFNGNTWIVLDYEWAFEMDIPIEFILYRSVFYLIYQSPYQIKLEQMNLYERAGVPVEHLPVFAKMEQSFQSYVVGDTKEIKQYYNRGIDIKKMMVQRIWEEREITFQVFEDIGNGIREEDSNRVLMELDDDNSFCFTYTPDSHAVRVRIDPGEKAVVLHLETWSVLEHAKSNGRRIGDKTIYFPEPDPWFEFDNPGHSITICGKLGKVDEVVRQGMNIFIHEYDREVKQIQSYCDSLAENLDETKVLLTKVFSSRSWKITMGMRKIFGALRRRPMEEFERPQIAVHLHLFYTDLLDEFIEYFTNISDFFDLYISCVGGTDKKDIYRKVRQKLPLLRKIEVQVCENRGRDLAPFYVVFGKKLLQYQYVLHVHSKKSKHIQEGGAEWRRYSLDSLLGSRELVADILKKLKQEPDAGLIYPDWHPEIPMIGYTWMANGRGGKALLESMGIPYREGLFFYPTGSFFWAKVEAIRPLFERGFTNKNFPAEQGQIDGTFAHVLERALAFVIKSRGYHSYIVDIEEQVMRRDRTLKPFREYLVKSKEMVLLELKKYESISFAVFGTLIDFIPYRDEDIVEMVRERLGLDEVFVKMRKEAEHRARINYGSAMTIDDIYRELIEISPFDEVAAMQLRNAELDCIGTNVAPRKEMQEIYRQLITLGKKIAIVCDTYYSEEVIKALLAKCGYIGYDKIWVSCEYGISKQDEQLWNLVYAQYEPKYHIHLGSDVYADWYTLERRGVKSMYVMSAKQAYELSDIYEEPLPTMSLQESIELGRRVKQELFPSPFGLAEREGIR